MNVAKEAHSSSTRKRIGDDRLCGWRGWLKSFACRRILRLSVAYAKSLCCPTRDARVCFPKIYDCLSILANHSLTIGHEMNWLELSLDDDPETLRAALALLDGALDTQIDVTEEDVPPMTAFDSTGKLVTATSDSSECLGGTQSNEELRETSPAKRTGTRRKRKDEIQQLQQKVAKLEMTLSDLRHQSQSRVSVLSSVATNAVTPGLVWKDIALRQSRHRRDTETENQKLRTMLHAQTMVGQQLLHLLQGTAAQQVNSGIGVTSEQQPCKELNRVEQYRHLDDLFARVDRAFVSECFQTTKPSFQDLQINEDGSTGMVMDIRAGWVVPFSPNHATDALWECMAHIDNSKVCKSVRMDVEAEDDTLITSFTINTASLTDLVYGSCTGTALTRRYHTGDDSYVVVSMMSGEMLGSTPMVRDGISIFEEQWMRIRPLPSLIDSESGPVTQVHICRQIRLNFPVDHSEARRGVIHSIIQLILQQVEDDITRKQEMVERLLLQAKA